MNGEFKVQWWSAFLFVYFFFRGWWFDQYNNLILIYLYIENNQQSTDETNFRLHSIEIGKFEREREITTTKSNKPNRTG